MRRAAQLRPQNAFPAECLPPSTPPPTARPRGLTGSRHCRCVNAAGAAEPEQRGPPASVARPFASLAPVARLAVTHSLPGCAGLAAQQEHAGRPAAARRGAAGVSVGGQAAVLCPPAQRHWRGDRGATPTASCSSRCRADGGHLGLGQRAGAGGWFALCPDNANRMHPSAQRRARAARAPRGTLAHGGPAQPAGHASERRTRCELGFLTLPLRRRRYSLLQLIP